MLTFICIVSLIIVIIAIYQYRKLVVVEDTVEGFNSGGYNWYGIPRNWKKDVLYIVVIADDYLDLYHIIYFLIYYLSCLYYKLVNLQYRLLAFL